LLIVDSAPMVKKIAISFIIALSFAFLQAQTTYKNPIITGMNPDPSICRVGDDYYLISSTFEYFPGLPIYHSKDLVHWKMIGYVLSRASNNPLMGCESGTGGQYAPTLRHHDSTFYVICTNYGGQGSRGVFYVTATNPAGPWSDPHWVNNWYVDPSLMFENDSAYFLSPDNNGSFLLGTLNPNTGTFIKPLEKIAEGLGGPAPEGPHMYKIKEYYYLMSAEGGTGYEHREVIQRSKSPWGPFAASPINPVISHMNAPDNPFQAIGHADLVQLQDSSWWLVCLGFRTSVGRYHHLGRETFLAPVTWDSDGWPKTGSDGIVEEELPTPNLTEYIWPKETKKDDFDSTSLRQAWNFIRNPHDVDWSLTSRPGFLRLNGSKMNFKQKDSPAFICRRQTAFNLSVSAKISFIAAATNEEAGLVVRGNDKNHFDFVISLIGGKRVVILRKYIEDKIVGLNYKEIPDTVKIILRITATNLQYSFWVQQEGQIAELIGISSTIDLSTEKIGGFTGTYIGMYASGNGTANTNPADFDWFEFEENPVVPFSWATGAHENQNKMETPVIITELSDEYDKVRIVWKNISNETAYVIERLIDNKFDSVGVTGVNDTVFGDSGLSGNSMYIYRILGKNNDGYSYPSVATSVFTLPKPGPYSGISAKIPGKIESENYDFGKSGVSYHDTDPGNNGGKYRKDDVDIETCGDAGNQYDIGWNEGGEWLVYTVDVNDTISDIEFRVASNYGGSIKLELNGKEIARTGIPVTGGWQTWKTVTLKDVKLDMGKNKKLKVTILSGGFNLNWINFVRLIRSTSNCFLRDFVPKPAIIPPFELTEKTSDPPDVTITLSSDTLGKISKYIFGNAIAAWMGNVTGSPVFVENVQTLAPSLIRFPGGSWSDIFFWNGKPADIPDSLYDGTSGKKSEFYAISGQNDWSTTVDNYYTLRAKTGSQGLITINYGYARYGLSEKPAEQAAHLAAEWVRYDKGRTKFWEIGNENAGPWEAGWMIDTETNRDGQPQIITGELYGQHFNIFADSMRTAAAEIGAKIFIGSQVLHFDGAHSWNAPDRTWNAGCFKEVGDAADFYVMHNYFGTSATVDNLLSVATTEPKKNIDFINQDISDKKASSKPVALTEYNMNGNSANTSIGISYINGIQEVILFNELLKNNFGLSARWLLATGETGMFYQGSNASWLWQGRPEFYYAYYQQIFTGDHVIPATSNNTNILGYASRYASGETGIVVVNRGTTSRVVKINPANIKTGNKYYVYSLTGGNDNGEFSLNVSVNDVTPDGTQWGPRENLENIPSKAFITEENIIFNSPDRSVQFIMVDAEDTVSIPTTIDKKIKNKPLVTCYPNPFTASTKIEFQTFSTASVSLEIYNQVGVKIATIFKGILPRGVQSADFDGSSLLGGVYFYELQVDDFSTTGKMVIIK